MPVLILLVVIAVAVFWILRSRELFVLRVDHGKVRVVRGNARQGLVAEFAEALRTVDGATITVRRSPSGAVLSTRGDIDGGTEQRLRNILGMYPASKMMAREIDKRGAVNDILTVSWFLSLFRRR